MPLFEYKCQSCGHTLEKLEKLEKSVETADLSCPKCGRKELRKLISSFSCHQSGNAGRQNNTCPTGTCPFN